VKKWCYSKGGEQQGPVSQKSLENLIQNGQINPITDPFWSEGMPEWITAIKNICNAVNYGASRSPLN
jgi:hypothetical protein